MAITSLLRSRRFAARQAEATQKLILFYLQQERFALPLDTVQKVVILGDIYSDPQRPDVILTNYQDKELALIDVGHQVFGLAPGQHSCFQAHLKSELVQDQTDRSQPGDLQQHLLVIQNSVGKIAGLPISGQPSLQRIPESSLVEVPFDYVFGGKVQCLSSVMVKTESETLFLLNPDQLVQI